MSDDLISRKAVIDYLREQNNNVIIEKQKDGFVSEDICRGMESAISAFRNFILTLPTAFDKEKVRRQLIELRNEEIYKPDAINKYAEARSQGRYSAFLDAIRIVEKGGIE